MDWSLSPSSSSSFWLFRPHPRSLNQISRRQVVKWTFNRCPTIWKIIGKRPNSDRSTICLRGRKRILLLQIKWCVWEFSMVRRRLNVKITLHSETRYKRPCGIMSSINSILINRVASLPTISHRVFMFTTSHSTLSTTTSIISLHSNSTKATQSQCNNTVPSSTSWSRGPRSLMSLWPRERSILTDSDSSVMSSKMRMSTARETTLKLVTIWSEHSLMQWTLMEMEFWMQKKLLVSSRERRISEVDHWASRASDHSAGLTISRPRTPIRWR